MKMQYWLMAALVLAGPALADPTPFAPQAWQKAQVQARHNHKLLMVDFYTTWCAPCQQLDRVTWTDPHVLTWLKAHTISLRLDAEKATGLAARYHVRAYPTIVFLRTDGSEADRLVGFRPPQTFLQEGDSILHGQNSVTRLHTQISNGHQHDPMVRMQLGQALAERGQDAEALKQYLWCFDHGLESPAYAGVRLSYLLAYILELGQSYPPALTALEARRDAAEAHLTADKAMDVAALNEAFKTPERTLRCYDASQDATIRHQLFFEVAPKLLEAHRYQDVVDGGGDLDIQVGNAARMVSQIEEHLGPTAQPELIRSVRQAAVSRCAIFYEALLGVHQPDKAQQLADRLLKMDGGAHTYMALMQHAAQAGEWTTAHRLGDEGWKNVADDEKGVMIDAMQQTFKNEPSPSPSP
ncbi:MAG TPA: thioredoxin fold domain-containing protein [Candidatus Xenobia bacterium]|jgi:thioredoxin-like negative regulator of GroEL